MPVPVDPGSDQQQLVRYLLELVPERDRERFDEASIADDDFAARLRMAEDDLVDSYVTGALTGELRARLESHYLASPTRRDRVRFAGGFLRSVERVSAPDADSAPLRPVVRAAEAASLPDAARVVRMPTRVAWSRPMVQLAAVAALAIVAFGGLLLQTVRMRDGLSVAQTASVASDRRVRDLEQQLTDARAANAEISNELERVRGSMTAQPQPGQTDAGGAGLLAALVLLPQTRSIGTIPSLAIPDRAARARLELELEANDFTAYRAALKDPASNQTVWQSAWLTATTRDGTSVVALVLPAQVLKPQHYSIALMGRKNGGDAEVVGSYAFEAFEP